MKHKLLRIFTVLLSAVMTFTAVSVSFNASAKSASQIRQEISALEEESQKLESEIKELQGKINEQQALKNAIQSKINNVQKQIDVCNSAIAELNSKIAENKAKIEAANKEIEADKTQYKKRLRAIQMGNSGSDLQVLLGAEDFSEFLQLAQYTSTISNRDKKLIDKLMANIEALNEKQKENDKLLAEQIEIKKTVTAKQEELQAENNKIQSVINEIDGDQTKLEKDNKSIENQIKSYNNTLNAMLNPGTTSFVYDGGAFTWPCPGFYSISAGWQSNDSVHKGKHYGIDIAGGGISGAKIVAIADGVVTKAYNSCTHNYKKYGSCGCGGGYGNYVTVNHGTNNGNTYVATYGHMVRTAVGVGTTVKKGQTIGYVGTTGWSTGYHLHFGLAVNGSWRNPMNYFKRVG